MVVAKSIIEKDVGDKKKGRANWIDKHVGQALRNRRSLLGLTQQDLAAKLGITFQQLQKYENGTNRVSAGRLYEIAGTLGVPVGFFFEECEQRVSKPKADKPRERKESLIEQQGLLESKETLALLRTFYAIEDAGLRQNLLKLTRQLARNLKEASEG